MLLKELVVGGKFDNWVGDNPIGWLVQGEAAPDPEVSEVGAGQGHGGAGTGYCNLYASGTTDIRITQNVTLVIGRKYQFSMNVEKITANFFRIVESLHTMWAPINYFTTGIKSFTFVATHTTMQLIIKHKDTATTDLTFDDASIREDMPIGLSRTGHSFASRQEM